MAEHVCPVWVGYLLLNPLRKLWHNPRRLLGPYVHEGMYVLDVGCGMGFFSLPMAHMVGHQGAVFCADVQEEMLKRLYHRAERAGLDRRIQVNVCGPDRLEVGQLAGKIDFVLAFAVVHETRDVAGFFEQVGRALKTGGKLFLAEPRGHVSKAQFERTIATAEMTGLRTARRPGVAYCHAAMLVKPSVTESYGP